MKMLYQQAPATPLTSISLMLPRTGVCLDPSGVRGATRLMGRLMFMGAGGMDNWELNSRLERLGASMGASLANDFAVLRLETLTANLDAALELFLLSVLEPQHGNMSLARQVGGNALACGDPLFGQRTVEAVQATGVEQVRDVLERYLVSAPGVTVIQRPDGGGESS